MRLPICICLLFFLYNGSVHGRPAIPTLESKLRFASIDEFACKDERLSSCLERLRIKLKSSKYNINLDIVYADKNIREERVTVTLINFSALRILEFITRSNHLDIGFTPTECHIIHALGISKVTVDYYEEYEAEIGGLKYQATYFKSQAVTALEKTMRDALSTKNIIPDRLKQFRNIHIKQSIFTSKGEYIIVFNGEKWITNFDNSLLSDGEWYHLIRDIRALSVMPSYPANANEVPKR